MGGSVGKIVGVALAPVTGGASLVWSNQQSKAEKAAKQAAQAQVAQAQALIAEQKNAEATAKAQATAARRATHANDTQTNYTTALGAANEDVNSVKKKKTLLGS